MRYKVGEFWGAGRFALTVMLAIILLCATVAVAVAGVSVEGDAPDDGYLYVEATSDLSSDAACLSEPKMLVTATWGWGDYKMNICTGNSCSLKIDISLRKSGTVKLEATAITYKKN